MIGWMLGGAGIGAVAGWLSVRGNGPSRPRDHRRSRALVPVAAVVAAVFVVGVIWWLAGGRVGVLALVGLEVGGTVILARGRNLRERRAEDAAEDVARACQVLAGELELGHVPVTALRHAAEDCPVLAEAAAVTSIGGDPVAQWHRQARKPGHSGLAWVARAWRISQLTGAPMGPALARVATTLRDSREIDRTVADELAAPRFTGRMLAVLPVAGLALGYLIGGDPIGFLLGSPWGQACLVSGTLLTCLGMLWTEHLAAGDRRLREGADRGDPSPEPGNQRSAPGRGALRAEVR